MAFMEIGTAGASGKVHGAVNGKWSNEKAQAH